MSLPSSTSSSSLRSVLSEIEEEEEEEERLSTRPPSESSIVTPVIRNPKQRLPFLDNTTITRPLVYSSGSPQRRKVYSDSSFPNTTKQRHSLVPPPPPTKKSMHQDFSMSSSPEYQILLDTKYSKLLDHSLWFKLALTLDGRDKLTKLLQYLSRLGVWYWDNSPKLLRLKAALTQSRKAYRLGKTFMEMDKLYRLGVITGLQETVSAKRVSMGMDRLLLTAIRLLGMMGFWSADNIGFLASAGAIDGDKALVSRCAKFANRSYFVAAVTGLYLNAMELLRNRQKLVNSNDDERNRSARDKYYGVLLATIKSTCDVLVFSNNPGVDLWKNHTGHKMNEGFHCLCGLISASTVLCKNFPNDEPST